LHLAREGAQTTVLQLQQYETERRYATLVAILVEATATLTDEILDLHDRMIGSFFTKAKNKHEKTFAAAGKAINEKLRRYAKAGSVLIDARKKSRDFFSAIETVVPWDGRRSSNQAHTGSCRHCRTPKVRGDESRKRRPELTHPDFLRDQHVARADAPTVLARKVAVFADKVRCTGLLAKMLGWYEPT
jgi:hypothetical protein